MRYQEITDESVASLAEKLQQFKKISSIDFQCCDITGSAISSITAAALTGNNVRTETMRTLILSGNRLSSQAGVELGKSLAKSSLEILELADCGLRNPVRITLNFEKKNHGRKFCNF